MQDELSPKYRIKRTPENKEEIVLDEMGNEVPQITKRVKEEVSTDFSVMVSQTPVFLKGVCRLIHYNNPHVLTHLLSPYR